MKNDFFDKQVREKMAGHEAPVPADAWANIQKGKKKRRPFFLVWLLASLLLCGGAGLYLYTNPGNKSITSSTRTLKNDPKKSSGTKEEPSAGKTNELSPVTTANTIFADNKENNATSISSTYHPGITPVNDEEEKRYLPGKANKNKRIFSKKYLSAKHTKAGSLAAGIAGVNDDDNDGSNPKKKKGSTDGKLAIQITPPVAADEGSENDNNGTVFKKQEPVYTIDTVLTAHKENPTVIDTTGKQTAASEQKHIAGTSAKQDKGKKKKARAGLDIDLSLSGFMPAANRTSIEAISRTTVEPLHKAVFTANNVKVRLQPSIGFNVAVFKSLSSKFSVGAGFSYHVIKEYIHLKGEEINTNYIVVKRLNGNILIDDTVTTTSKGTRNIDAVNSYTLFSLPFSFRYRLLQGSQWKMDIQAGMDINLQSKYKNSIGGELVPQFSTVNNTKRNKTIGTGFNIAVRMSRRVGKNYWLYASPYLQLNPTTLYLKEMLAPATLHRTGVSFGISYRL